MPGQQGAGELGGDQLGVGAGAEDEEQVHPAHLLDVALLHRVEPDDLVAAGRDGLLLGEQAGGVVAGALDVAGAAGRRPDVVLGQVDRDRLHAAREVRARPGWR